MQNKKINWISASKLDTLDKCSWLYWAKYHLKIPSKTNSGALRGDIAHRVLECLIKDKNKKYVDRLKKDGNYYNCGPVLRMVKILSKKHNIESDETHDLINSFLQVAIDKDFYGPKDVKEKFIEKEFNIQVNKGNIKYNIRGFIDVVFICGNNKKGLKILCRDYKTSKVKFDGEKLDFNIQEIIYKLACREIYKEIKEINLDFIFLRFPKDPLISTAHVGDNTMEGVEYFLTEQQKIIDNFTEKMAKSGFAYDKGYPTKSEGFSGRLICGPKDINKLKANGEKPYYCEAREPCYYFEILNDKKEHVESVFDEKEAANKKKNEKWEIVAKYYPGCARFHGYKQPTEEYSTDF